ncbi:Extracellular matrix protein FRAS1 [Lonchura striata]|uniref:Extracellular matrix protein FRAS1 n=1 Tax=Lonchura striata TaxID=40157 RepID=A0A218UNF0_9PASE|nr:Extracellular matrix protein FRAS1 [Lonchura striata domestica]
MLCLDAEENSWRVLFIKTHNWNNTFWKPDSCQDCRCRSGVVTCEPTACKAPQCDFQKGEVLQIASNKCCPECASRAEGFCQHEGQIHSGQSKVQRPGKCCEECVSSKGSCLDGGTVRYHGEMWNSTRCDFCVCQEGQVTCQGAECAKVECAKGEELIHLEGKCCPECMSSHSDCVYKEHAKAIPFSAPDLSAWQAHSVPRRSEAVFLLQNGQTWAEGPCRECECRDAAVTCFQRSCPPCPPGSRPREAKGDCCPRCQPGECHPDCVSCSQASDHCDSCRDPRKRLQDGRCVEMCEQGFYQHGGACLACNETCSACTNGFECSSCQAPLLLKDGQCVPSCGEGYVQDQLLCTACHESCSSCWGAAESHCLSCKDPSHVLQAGFCLASCGQGFYPRDGVCTACHASCSTCEGPLATHCTSCSFPLALRQGLCLENCGEGFYQDHNICKECHSSCAGCVGNSSQDCTACLAPGVLLEGRCLPSCPEGLFSHRDRCSPCHPSCKTCHGPSAWECSTCHPHATLDGGKCRTGCEEEQYLGLVGYCVDCHPLCQQCVANLWDSGSVCLKCQHARHLLLGDRCVPDCPPGHYAEHGACKPCSSQCRSCDSAAGCTSCRDAAKVLLFGECQYESCAQQYYLDFSTKTCRECDWSCNTCKGPERTDCLQCTEGHFLHEGACVEECPPAFYQESDTCQRCDQPCLRCHQADKCSLCPAPFFLLGGVCVPKCGQRYYTDEAQRECTACPTGCLECDSGSLCYLCDRTTFLKNKMCVSACGQGFYGNPQTRECEEASRHPWSSRASSTLRVGIGGVQPLELALLGCDGASGQPLFQVDSIPSTGRLVLLQGAQEVPLSRGQRFSCRDVQDRRVRFVHGRDEPRKGQFSLKVSDQQSFSHLEVINIQAFSTQAPYVFRNEPLLVGRGGTGTISELVLGVGDSDNPEDVVLMALEPPRHGKLLGPPGDPATFRLGDLAGGRLRYAHDGSDSRQDAALLQVSDGYHFQNILLHIRIAPEVLVNASECELLRVVSFIILFCPFLSLLIIPHFSVQHLATEQNEAGDRDPEDHSNESLSSLGADYVEHPIPITQTAVSLFLLSPCLQSARSPRLVTNSLVWVPQGGMLQISKTILHAELPGARDSDITYTIAEEQPRHGEVVLLVPMPADGPADSWQLLPDGRAASPTSSFTQQDISDGIVWYRHSGAEVESDSFQFQVSSSASPQTSLESHVFNVAVLPQTPKAPQLSLGSSLHMAFHYKLDPNSSSRNEHLDESGLSKVVPSLAALIGKMVVEFQVGFVGSQTVVQAFPVCPHHVWVKSSCPLYFSCSACQAQGIVEHKDRPLSPARYFTQADINHGRIAYRPPTAAPHLREIMAFSFAGLLESVSFRFTVSGGEHTSPEMVFVIHLLSAEQQPPVFQIAAPFLEVSQGGRATIGIQLAVSDTDTAPEGLFFELVKPPHHGIVLKYSADVQELMRAGDSFTYEDVTRNALQYVHDGSSAAEDSMEISVTDGVTTVTTVLRVDVSQLDTHGPQLAPGCLLAVTVASKSSVTLSRQHLAYTDNNSPDSEIRIQLISLPAYGTLLRMSGSHSEELSKVYNFTMEDINSQRISYSTTFETSNQPVTDIFHFSVLDADNNRLDRQMFTVTITSALALPALIAFADHVTVDEGGRVPLLAHHHFTADYDTAAKEDLRVTVVTLPVYGYIENTRTGESFGPQSEAVGTTDASFSLQDVLEKSIYYFQSVHESIEPTSDVFSFYVSDGFSQSEVQSINITIQRQNDEPPRMVLEPVRVQGGSAVVVTNASLSLQDLDTQSSELVIVVSQSPEHGQLRRRQSAAEALEQGRVLSRGSSFTYQDVLDELIVYTRSGAAAQTDEFSFSLTDGLHTQAGRLEFSMELPRKQLPMVAVNRDLQLPAGHVVYSHGKGDPGGNFPFIFDVMDADGNKLMDQVFHIHVMEDRFAPSIITNKGLVLDENSAKAITTLQLSATDQESEASQLQYKVTRQPQLGHLEHVASPGTRISSFSQADLASGSIQYIHTSDTEKHRDAFTFSVSDGTNEVSQTFDITINPVDDSLPVVQIFGMTVQEGVRKTITEFELKATDADTEVDSITFRVVQPPRHGLIERGGRGQRPLQASTFTMGDIYQNLISYSHDGSGALRDRFTFTVSDGTNPLFVVQEGGRKVVTAAPQRFQVDILPVDDGTPTVVTNLGLQWLEYTDGKATNLITKKELLTTDPDTDDKQLIYEITTGPRNGHVENKLKPGTTVTTFTQEDVNQGLIQYVMHEEKVQETMDSFQFLVKDGKPNVVSGNVFHIQWSLLSFTHTSYKVRESAGSVSVTVRRVGNLNQYSIVLCRTEQGTAAAGAGSRPGEQDYVEYAGQVQFEEREDTKACTIAINDDDVFEGTESFSVELSMPAYALLGNVTRATVTIADPEDEPTLQFDRSTFHVSESAGFLSAPVQRKGDASSTVSAICYTIPKSARGSSLYMLESGSDFKSRGLSDENRLILGPGVTVVTCDVTLIDDSEYEEEEEFEVVLADASDNARLGSRASANVVIAGPNDASTVFLGNATFTVSEAAGHIEIPVLRQGPDLSTPVSVWCATRTSDPPSASPGVDYVPSSRKIEFRPGKTEEFCPLTILDDAQYPVIEGLETFVVYLSSPHGAELAKPFQAIVAINDIFQDVPSMQFTKDTYTAKEKEGTLHIPIFRTGDLSYESSVRCYTRSQTAQVMEDFTERRDTEESRITFLKGEKVKNCSVHISDDSAFEPEEQFQVYLGSPLGNHWSGARIGKMDMATITVTNDEDAPTIEFEEAAYQVREPPGPEAVAVLAVPVLRRGDRNRTSKVRCSTRDGSAQAGLDYYPKSRMLKFSPGVAHIMFKVEIMSNEDREWHESFSLVLGPDDPVEAVLGDISTATVTILDQEAAGSLILPAPPVVVTLADYDRVEEVTKEGAKKSPSPGYPLICVTPCDPHFPKYALMKERCGEAGINQSSIQFSWEVAAPTDGNGARSPFETITDNTPFTSVNHRVLDSIYFSRRFHVRCVAKAVDKAGHVGTPLRSNVVTIGTDSAICHTPVVAGTARGFQAQSFIATLKYLDVKHKEHPNRIHISVQIPHQDGMLPLISTLPLHNLHFLLSESIYRHQHVCSNLVTVRDLRGISEAGFLDEVTQDSSVLGPGYDRPYQLDPAVREPKSIQLYQHLNLKSCIWTFDAFYDMTELIDVCGGSVTADFQVRDSAQSFLTVHVPLYVSYIYVTAPRGWASLEHHTEMEFSFFYDTVLWRTGIQADSVLSARLQIIRIYIRDDGRLVIEFRTQAKFRGLFVMEHHSLPDVRSSLMTPEHLGGIEFDLQLLWSAQTFDSPYQLWRATSSYNRKDYSGEYTIFLIPCTVQPTQPWAEPGDKPLPCTAHAPERFLIPIAFQQTNRPVPVVYSLNTEFQLCNNEKVFLMDPTKSEMSLAEMDYKGAFSKGQILYGRVLWHPEQNLNAAYKLQLEKVYLCTGRDGYVPFFDPTGTVYNEGPQYGCIQPNKYLKHRFLLLDRNQPEVTDKYFHDVPFDAHFASELSEFHSVSSMPGVDGFTLKVDALYKVEAGHQWYLQVIYVIGPEGAAGPRVQRSLARRWQRGRRDLPEGAGRPALDDSLVYDNEGDQLKNGTNMKSLLLEREEAAAAASLSQAGASLGSAFAALTLLLLVLCGICLLARECRKVRRKREAARGAPEEHPLNTKVELPRGAPQAVGSRCCTVRNVHPPRDYGGVCRGQGRKVKQVNLEVKVHSNLHDGTEV